MPTIHVMTGLPASGKTTRALQLLAESAGRMRRVSLDSIRAMLDEHGDGRTWTHKHEGTAQRIQEEAVLAALRDGFDVVVDNTHLTTRMPGRLRAVVAGEATFVVHDFTDVPVDECVRRDAGREKPVGEETILRLHQRHRSATKGGWRLTAEWMNDQEPVRPYVADPSLPSAILCDIDGTLAINVSRGPYDFERCGEDALNASVAHALATYAATGEQIVLLSGRSEEHRERTLGWLGAHQVPFDELWMRHQGDQRRDDIVKAELFDAHVRDRFAVRFSLDDRDRVVAVWRRMGLPTWQVNYGDF
ncbi:AAA family ATPase [Kitasatospora sp. NPDC050543]|uniref:phosphatase domain-containing protein n=1 Tax=Kitasatospora sp. NPDC050543 TaxID=3364054 RepID=UPI00379BAE96